MGLSPNNKGKGASQISGPYVTDLVTYDNTSLGGASVGAGGAGEGQDMTLVTAMPDTTQGKVGTQAGAKGQAGQGDSAVPQGPGRNGSLPGGLGVREPRGAVQGAHSSRGPNVLSDKADSPC